ncbi:MAG TPA: cytochrome c1 [Arenimonas sp.]|nr:cytochrome c1 [Arenimonas sp.]
MTKSRFFAILLALLPAVSFAAAGVKLEASHTDLDDRASLQRGAALYMNYCSACHSLSLQRYSRIADDLGLSAEQVEQNLMFGTAKIGETIHTGFDPAKGEKWFGKAAPDLSLVARAKLGGPDWVYSYLKGFYLDETRPLGWNNTVFPGASMPHVLWELQGLQRAVYKPVTEGAAAQIDRLELVSPGRLSPQEYDRVARDLTAFLQYTAEPAALKRYSIGVWVVLFLSFFTFIAYLLKLEFWRDVH